METKESKERKRAIQEIAEELAPLVKETRGKTREEIRAGFIEEELKLLDEMDEEFAKIEEENFNSLLDFDTGDENWAEYNPEDEARVMKEDKEEAAKMEKWAKDNTLTDEEVKLLIEQNKPMTKEELGKKANEIMAERARIREEKEWRIP